MWADRFTSCDKIIHGYYYYIKFSTGKAVLIPGELRGVMKVGLDVFPGGKKGELPTA